MTHAGNHAAAHSAEESLTRLSDSNVLAANRWFETECPQCGPVLQNKMGHHATIQTKRLKKEFPKAQLLHLRSQLSTEDFEKLEAAREGKQAVTEQELERWRRAIE